MKVYKHYRPRDARLPLILLGTLAAAAFAGLVWTVPRGMESDPPFPVFLLPLVFLLVSLWLTGSTALEARLGDDGHVEFVAPLRRYRVPVLEILSIAPSDLMQGKVYVLKHRGGALRFDPKLTGMHELITALKAANPRIELRGI